MVKYRRNKLDSPDAIYFFTIVMAHRKPWFKKETNSKIAVKAMNLMIKKFGVKFHAWIILPDHIHWLIQPVEADYSNVVFAFKRRITARLKAKYDIIEGASIWQDRFWEHTIKDEKEYSFYVDYVNYNPVKHGYVMSPIEWKHSSFENHMKQGLYDIDWALRSGEQIAGDNFDIE